MVVFLKNCFKITFRSTRLGVTLDVKINQVSYTKLISLKKKESPIMAPFFKDKIKSTRKCFRICKYYTNGPKICAKMKENCKKKK